MGLLIKVSIALANDSFGRKRVLVTFLVFGLRGTIPGFCELLGIFDNLGALLTHLLGSMFLFVSRLLVAANPRHGRHFHRWVLFWVYQ